MTHSESEAMQILAEKTAGLLADPLPGYEPSYIYDNEGNPTEETLHAFYEFEHGLTTPLTMEELQEWLDEIR